MSVEFPSCNLPLNVNMSQAIDVKQWLSDNQLLDVHEIFIKRDISIEEIVEFEISDLQLISITNYMVHRHISDPYTQLTHRDFAKDIGLDTLQKNRFVKGITKLKSSYNDINDNKN